MSISRRLACEFLGTAFLLATVVGSGILEHKIDAGNVAVSVSAIAIATGCILTALILSFGMISSHFNPIVTLCSAIRKEMSWSEVPHYIFAQIAGACCGVILTNLMFDLPAVTVSATARFGMGQWLGEFVAIFGLLGVIFGCGKFRPAAIPAAVGLYVAAAIWFTSSTCFANPAVTIARMLTDTLTGIRPSDVPPFILAQLTGAAAALAFFGWLYAPSRSLLEFSSGAPPVVTRPSSRREDQLVGSAVGRDR